MSDEQTNAPQRETASWFADNQANWDSRAHAHMFGNYGGKGLRPLVWCNAC